MELAQFLEKEKITQRAFAKMIGVEPLAVNRYVKRKRKPRLETLLKIIEVTNGAVTPEDFAA